MQRTHTLCHPLPSAHISAIPLKINRSRIKFSYETSKFCCICCFEFSTLKASHQIKQLTNSEKSYDRDISTYRVRDTKRSLWKCFGSEFHSKIRNFELFFTGWSKRYTKNCPKIHYRKLFAQTEKEQRPTWTTCGDQTTHAQKYYLLRG